MFEVWLEDMCMIRCDPMEPTHMGVGKAKGRESYLDAVVTHEDNPVDVYTLNEEILGHAPASDHHPILTVIQPEIENLEQYEEEEDSFTLYEGDKWKYDIKKADEVSETITNSLRNLQKEIPEIHSDLRIRIMTRIIRDTNNKEMPKKKVFSDGIPVYHTYGRDKATGMEKPEPT